MWVAKKGGDNIGVSIRVLQSGTKPFQQKQKSVQNMERSEKFRVKGKVWKDSPNKKGRQDMRVSALFQD